MPYRVNPDGTIETDTAEEALNLAALLDRKKHGRRPNAGNGGEPAAAPKTRTRRRGTPKTRTAANNGRRPAGAVEYGIKLGQVWEKRAGGKSAGRQIQVAQLLKDGIMPKVLKDAPGLKKSSSVKKISYKHLRDVYKLVKDV
jgi:hypothetical protein